MANFPDMIDKQRLGVFLEEIKNQFPTSVNNVKQDSKGNISLPSFTGSTSSTNGKEGIVPAPKAGEENKVLKADGTWYDILKFISDSYQAKEAGKGLSANDFTTALLDKLNGIGAGANGLGIIAANLAQNGYVKFANGLILQWGYIQFFSDVCRFSFPVSFVVSQISIVVTRANGGTEYSEIYTDSLQVFANTTHGQIATKYQNDNAFYIVLGV